jgi:hypothetical protein
LLAKDIPPVHFIIPGLLPATGLAVVGGAPKMGKSIMMTDLGLAISGGGRFLNVFDVGMREVLYLCLEDTEQRMQERIKKMQPDCPGSGCIHLAFNWDDKGVGALSHLGSFLDSHPNIKMVIIDTISRFSKLLAGGQYSKQYEEFAELKKFADMRNILIMIVHHLRKSKSDDPFEMLYGSNAITGAADLIWILQRERSENCANLIVSGRDVPDQTLSLRLVESLLTWIVDDQTTADLLGPELQKVFDILYNKGVAMSLAEISTASGFKKPVLSKYLKMLIEHGYIEKTGHGKYRIKHGKREEEAGFKELPTKTQPRSQEFNDSGTMPCDEYGTVDPSPMSRAA